MDLLNKTKYKSLYTIVHLSFCRKIEKHKKNLLLIGNLRVLFLLNNILTSLKHCMKNNVKIYLVFIISRKWKFKKLILNQNLYWIWLYLWPKSIYLKDTSLDQESLMDLKFKIWKLLMKKVVWYGLDKQILQVLTLVKS